MLFARFPAEAGYVPAVKISSRGNALSRPKSPPAHTHTRVAIPRYAVGRLQNPKCVLCTQARLPLLAPSIVYHNPPRSDVSRPKFG